MLKKSNIDVTNLSDKQYEYVINELESELKRLNEENSMLEKEVIDRKDYINYLKQILMLKKDHKKSIVDQ